MLQELVPDAIIIPWIYRSTKEKKYTLHSLLTQTVPIDFLSMYIYIQVLAQTYPYHP